jgi:hypothetical protein
VSSAGAGGQGPSPRDELAEATAHGGLYLRRLVRAQLGLSVLTFVAFGGFLGALPLALYLLPALMDLTLFGVPLPLLALSVPLFPIFLAFGWLYSRRAAALEQQFRDLVEPPP